MSNVLFVKFENKYSSLEVNSLYKKLHHFGPQHNYYCYTDDPVGLNSNIMPISPMKPTLRKWWNKLRMLGKDFPVYGDNIFFDIDVNIVDNPFGLLEEYNKDKLNLVSCYWKDAMLMDRFDNAHHFDVNINSSIMVWNTNSKVNKIWEDFADSPYRDYWLRKYKGLDRYIVYEGHEYDLIDRKWIKSYVNEPEDKIAPIITYEEFEFEIAGST